jgi:hypothetical protein
VEYEPEQFGLRAHGMRMALVSQARLPSGP